MLLRAIREENQTDRQNFHLRCKGGKKPIGKQMFLWEKLSRLFGERKEISMKKLLPERKNTVGEGASEEK